MLVLAYASYGKEEEKRPSPRRRQWLRVSRAAPDNEFISVSEMVSLAAKVDILSGRIRIWIGSVHRDM